MAAAADLLPTLRWIYTKGPSRLLFELSLDGTESVYELRTINLIEPESPRIEQFGDALPALLRHDQLESMLVASGWSLDFFERRMDTLH